MSDKLELNSDPTGKNSRIRKVFLYSKTRIESNQFILNLAFWVKMLPPKSQTRNILGARLENIFTIHLSKKFTLENPKQLSMKLKTLTN